MNYRVVILPRAKQQMLDQATWWAKHRSLEQALRWLDGLDVALATLAHRADRCNKARESDAFEMPLRQLNYGVGPRPTHRAVFEIRDEQVIVHCVRNLAQRDLMPEDIA